MASEREYAEKAIRSLAELMSLPLLLLLSAEEMLVKSAPKGYSKALEHLINAQIETLNSAKAVLENRIEKLEKLKETITSSKAERIKEKVKVE